jgi:AraC-like DNA-binding protein
MYYQHFRPLPALARYIEALWLIDAPDAPDHRACLPADSRAELLLSFEGVSRLIAQDQAVTHHVGTGGSIIGVHSQSYTIEHDGETRLLAVRFRPGGLAAFIRCEVGELAEQTVALDLLWGSAAEWLCEQINETDDPLTKVALFQQALLAHLGDVPHQPRLHYALEQIDLANGSISVETLAAQVNLSQKQFERVFVRAVGMTPKRYARLARFQKLVWWLARCGQSVNWTTLAAQFGYYDHSHLVKDFNAFAGTTPSAFADATAGIVEVAYGEAEEV